MFASARFEIRAVKGRHTCALGIWPTVSCEKKVISEANDIQQLFNYANAQQMVYIGLCACCPLGCQHRGLYSE